MRADERTELFYVVLARPVETIRVAIESDAERKIEVEAVELEHAVVALWQRAGLHLNETPLRIGQVICLRSRRRQRAAVDGKCQPLADLALDSTGRACNATPTKLSLDAGMQVEKLRERQCFEVKISQDLTLQVAIVLAQDWNG